MTLREKIESLVAPCPLTGCWFWLSHVGNHGYGLVSYGGKQVLAHRASWECYRTPIPAGMTIDHLCRQRTCVNPDHLDVVTAGENTARSPYTRSSINRAKTHCLNGHPLTPDNLRKARGRQCKRCHVQRNGASRRRRQGRVA